MSAPSSVAPAENAATGVTELIQQLRRIEALLDPAAATSGEDEDNALDKLIVALILRLVDQRLAALVQQARQLTDSVWATHLQENRHRPRSAWGRVLVRARLHHGTIAIEWFIQRTSRAIDATSGRRRVFSEHLRKGRGYRYPLSAFKPYARDWELPLIETCEERFAELRRQGALWVKVRALVRRLKAAVEKTNPEAPEVP
jgi:hypothetical protein